MNELEMMEDMFGGDFSFLNGIEEKEKKFNQEIEKKLDHESELDESCNDDEGCLMCGS